MTLMNFELVGKLADGTAVSIDQFQTGGTIQLIAADGTKSVAKDGDYTFEDGSVATVTGGKISAITCAPADDNDTVSPEATAQASDAPADATATPADGEDDQADAELENQVAQLTDLVQQLAQKVAALEAGQATMSAQFESEKNVTAERFTAVSIPSSVVSNNTKTETPYHLILMENIKAFTEGKKRKK